MTTATETTFAPLTKLDIRSLREADNVSFHHINGKGRIVASKRVKNVGPWDERERDYTVEVSSHVYLHGDDSRAGDRTSVAKCFGMRHGTRDSEEWQTVVSCLKAGDVLSFRWVGADNNQYLNGERQPTDYLPLFHDRLFLRIKRAKAKRDLVFPIDDSVCPDNSARMIQV